MPSDTCHHPPSTTHGPTLRVDLAAIAANYRLLAERFSGRECAGVVKADAYGLGVAAVAPVLKKAGCRTFFVATLDEGIELRLLLPDVRIAVFHGPYAGEEKEYLTRRLVPVLNYPEQVRRWADAAADMPAAESMLHVDTGMNRLGLSHRQAVDLAGDDELARRAHIRTVMSHLACSGEPHHPLNAEQLARFLPVRHLFPDMAASLTNSSGIFLDQRFHFDLARPGCALYGIHPFESENPMRPVVTLQAPILQLRTIEQADTIGYGATCKVTPGQRIATVQLGYADGFLRHLSNQGVRAFLHGKQVALLGRVSMDMVMVDVSALPEALLAAGQHVEFLNASLTVNHLAHAAGTIGYEVLTRIGPRISKSYVG